MNSPLPVSRLANAVALVRQNAQAPGPKKLPPLILTVDDQLPERVGGIRLVFDA